MKTQTLTKVMTLTLMAALLASCGGKSTMGTDDQASRVSVNDAANSKPTAICSQGTSSMSGGTSVNLQIYKDPSTNKAVNSITRMQIKTISDAFKTSGNYLQLFRWMASGTGSVSQDPTPLNFRIVINNAVQTSIRGYSTSLTWSDVQSLSNYYHLNVSVPADFFKQVVFIVDLQDPSADYEVLRTMLFNTSNAAVDLVDTLIPLFYANPNDYATIPDKNGELHPAVLQNLHPLKNYINGGWSSSDYATEANGFCFSNF